MDERFWPFPLVEPQADWTTFDRDLMRIAYADGYRPRGTRGGESPSRRAIGVSLHAAILAAPEPMKICEAGRR
jgi:hypothetical protein